MNMQLHHRVTAIDSWKVWEDIKELYKIPINVEAHQLKISLGQATARRAKIIAEHLKPLPIVSYGMSRIVLDIGMGAVIKVPLCPEGFNKNFRELKIWNQTPQKYQENLAAIYDKREKFLVSEKVQFFKSHKEYEQYWKWTRNVLEFVEISPSAVNSFDCWGLRGTRLVILDSGNMEE